MKQLLLDIKPASPPTLLNFIAGRNEEALASLNAIADQAAQSNFIYLWGETGSGKSHLLSACKSIGMQVMDNVHLLHNDAQIELFNTYKASIPSVEASKGEVEDAKAAAKKVVDAAKTDAPVSLSDLPSGSPNQFSRDERVKGMNPVQMLDEMANWTPEQIESYVNRNT